MDQKQKRLDDDSDEDDRREHKREQAKKAEAPAKVEQPELKKEEANLLELDTREQPTDLLTGLYDAPQGTGQPN